MSRTPSLNLLLVDGLSHTRLTLTEFFTQHTNSTITGVESLALAEFVPALYDCALIDTDLTTDNINNISGFALARQLHELDPDLTLILTSDTYSAQKVALVFELGFDEFLLKPLPLKHLPYIINKARMRHAHNRKIKNRQGNYARKLELLNQALLEKTQAPANIAGLAQQLNKLDHNSEDIYAAMVNLAASYTKAEQAALMMLHHASGELLLLAERGFGSQFHGQKVACAGRGLCGKVAVEAQPMLARPGVDLPAEILPARGMCLALPVYMHNLVFGVLLLADKKTDFSAQDFFLLNFLISKVSLEIENRALYEYIGSNLYSTLAALISAMEAKDLYTRQHSQRVTNVALLIGQTMGLDSSSLNSLRLAAYLHDIGKIGIKDAVLLKPARLSDEEYEHIQQHTLLGDSIINPMELPWEERAIVLHHHERWDGFGYPHGLRGDAIPLLARIVAVADTYDAITSNRPYRPASSTQAACEEINKCAGSQFDPQIVNCFLQAMSAIKTIEVSDGFPGQTTLPGAGSD